MDPNACLQQIRALADRALRGTDYSADSFVELAELISGLDNWIMLGGFLPSEWENE